MDVTARVARVGWGDKGTPTHTCERLPVTALDLNVGVRKPGVTGYAPRHERLQCGGMIESVSIAVHTKNVSDGMNIPSGSSYELNRFGGL